MSRYPGVRECLFKAGWALLAALALNVLALSSSASAAATAQSENTGQPTPASIATISIGVTPGVSIAPTFMGIAHEWGDAQFLIGDSGSGINLYYRNLLKNLTAYGSGPLVVRIGGNSTDTSTAPTATTVKPFAELAAATGAHFYLGVNLGAANVQLATNQAKVFLESMPARSVDAIEIGNEPDSYVDKKMRKSPYAFSDYLMDFDTWRKQIYPLLPPGTRLLGPSWAYPASLKDAAAFLDAEHPYLLALSQHYYVGNACNGNTNPADTLLRPRASTDAPARMQNAASMAHAQHVGFRVDEVNSIACGGEDGVSNTFGSALWAIDIMFEFARAGVDGINWQTPNGAAYSFLSFNISHQEAHRIYKIKTIAPLYYGLLFFQAATGNHSRLVPVILHTSANIKAWATLDADGKMRLTLINKDNRAAMVSVAQPGCQSVSVSRLVASSSTARDGVHLAGQTLDGSADGMLQGARQVETIRPQGTIFQIPITAASALLAECNR